MSRVGLAFCQVSKDGKAWVLPYKNLQISGMIGRPRDNENPM